MIYHLVEYCLKDFVVLASVVVVWERRRVGFGDGESVFVRGEEVPVTTNK